jgi:hypothetical protein
MAEISELDHFFLISVGTLVLLLQSGYAFLEAGAVRSKNAVNICLRYATTTTHIVQSEILHTEDIQGSSLFMYYFFSMYRSYSTCCTFFKPYVMYRSKKEKGEVPINCVSMNVNANLKCTKIY